MVVLPFPAEVLSDLRKLAVEVVEEEAAKTPMAKKVNEAFRKFEKVVGPWATASEMAYYNIIMPKYAFK